MKPLTLLFSTNDMIGSVLIRGFTWSDYSHCDIVAGEGELIGAVPFKGVVSYPVLNRLEKSKRYMIVTVPGLDETLPIEIAADQVGKPYDWLGCLGIGLHRDWEEDDAWFCSELIAYACLRAGYPLLNETVRTNRITPQMLLESPRVLINGYIDEKHPEKSFLLPPPDASQH